MSKRGIEAKTIGDVMEGALAEMRALPEWAKPREPTAYEIARAGRRMLDAGYQPFDRQAWPRLARWLAGDRSKGLFLVGSVGVGKTYFLERMTRATILSAKALQANTSNCRGLVETTFTLALDDLGTEPQSVTYGEREEVLATIIMQRHRWFVGRGTVTHLTANVPDDEIQPGPNQFATLKTRYGARVWDRLRDMCVLVTFAPGSHRG